jgi:LuxR family maltose regulon positive regulatory protein
LQRSPSDAAARSGLASDAQAGPPRFEFETVTTRAIALSLHADPTPKLVSACAPPGYGKTVLLSRLHAEFLERRQTCLWVSLDERDTDLSSLLYRIRGATHHSGKPIPLEGAGPVPPFPDRGASADGVLQRLACLRGPVALFIDNLGFCQDSALTMFLERLVFGTKPGLRLVLSSTREIPVDTVRAKLEVGALELRAEHLSFDRISTARLFERAGIAPTGQEDLDRIVLHTEGWPAAVRLLQVVMASGAGSIDQVLQRFGGDHSDIARVLTRRVLIGFDPELVQFMMEIALVREFSADLAAEMTGRAEASRWLEQLVTRNVLIFPLDRSRRWFRFHTLLRDFLLAEATERIDAMRRREVLCRAARWHVAHGDDVAAIGIALDAQSTELAQQLLDRIARVIVGDHGQMSTLIQWVDRLLEAGVMPSPEVHAWFVWALCDSLQYERARKALDDFDRRAATDASFEAIDGGAQLRLAFLRMLVNVWLDRLEAACQQAEAWLSQGWVADPLTMAAVTSIIGIAEIDRGAVAAARARMEQARAIIDRSDSAYGLAWVAILQACVEIGQARPDAADEILVEARGRVVRVIGADASVVVTLDFVHARALLDLGRVDAARELAARGLRRAMHHGILASLEQGLTASVAFWSDAEDDVVSSKLLDRVAHSYPSRGRLLLAASKARRLIQLGRSSDAIAVGDRGGLNDETHGATGSAPMRTRCDWMLAQLELHLARGACVYVLNQIEPLMKAARLQERHRDRIELLLLAADAHQRLGQERMAIRSFAMAVVIAAPGKLIQPFRMRHVLVGKLLSEGSPKDFGLTRASELSLLDRLLPEAGARGERATAQGEVAALAGVPTSREIQLLVLLEEGLSNEQVADRLCLSVPTVKWHLHNLYVKLGVRSRSAALARARTLQLITH